jgi:biopolymer transport protein ExbB
MLLSFLLQVTLTGAADTANKAASMVNTPVIPGPTQDTLSLWDLLIKGGVVMIPIGILFVIALYIFIERIMVISKARKTPANFMFSIKDFIKSGNTEAAKALCRSSSSPNAKLIERGVSRLGKPMEEIEKSMEDAGKFEVYRLEKNLGLLSIIGRIAPMLGFIGTIIGVINIFYKIALANTVEIDVISEGLYQKMITSAAGLLVGIFSFACHHIVQSMVEARIQAMEADGLNFIEIISEPGK